MSLYVIIPILLLLSYVTLNIHLYLERRKYRHFSSLRVSFGPWWFLGVAPQIKKRSEASPASTINEIFDEIHRETGWDIFYLPLFAQNLIYCIDLEMTGKILTDPRNFYKNKGRLSSLVGQRFLGPHSIFNESGTAIWHAKRKIMDLAFRRDNVRTLMPRINALVDNLVEELRKRGPEEVFDIESNLERASFEAIAKCGFCWSDEVVDKNADQLIKATRLFFKAAGVTHVDGRWFKLPWRRRQLKAEVRHTLKATRAILRESLLEHTNNTNNNTSNNGALSIISTIIHANSELEDMVDDALVFILAGMETSSVIMSLAIHNLTIYPEVYERAQAEVDRVFGGKKEIGFEELAELEYLEMIIKESMRFRPSPATRRECVGENTVINGMPIPKKTFIEISRNMLHQDSRYWKNPGVFDPERFSSAERQNIKRFTYMPFAAGLRNCVARNLAMIEMKAIISRILHNFDIFSPNILKDRAQIKTWDLQTARLRDGAMVKIKCRDSSFTGGTLI